LCKGGKRHQNRVLKKEVKNYTKQHLALQKNMLQGFYKQAAQLYYPAMNYTFFLFEKKRVILGYE
jgi:hypothetical protein